MQIKTNPDDFVDYRIDASNLEGGHAEKLFIPEEAAEIADILKEANAGNIPVTIAGSRTGLVGGSIPFGGYLISLEKFNRIKSIDKADDGGTAIVQAGVILADFQREVESHGLFYPPDPTEWSCQLGGTVSTNASGSRSFKYGSTRRYVKRLEIVLPTGEIINVKRGETFASNGSIALTTGSGRTISVKTPTYTPPDVRKNTSGYFSGEPLDLIDLFIGSEGTLGVITEIEFSLLKKPAGFLSGIVFFEREEDLLKFVAEARELSFRRRKNPEAAPAGIDATLLEYFDDRALGFIKEKFAEVPATAAGAVYFEQETTDATEDALFEQWNALLENHNADVASSWFTTTEDDRKKMREFRHALPVAVNDWIVRVKLRKVSTDIAVPDENFASMLRFYKQTLGASGLKYVIFGHIGDNHVHVNVLPKDQAEAKVAQFLYGRFIAQGVMLGGTVSAEHGIGKVKKKYLNVMYGERYLNEMAEIKRAFDPAAILGRGNMIDAKLL